MGNTQDQVYFGDDAPDRGDQPPPIRSDEEEQGMVAELMKSVPGAWLDENKALVDFMALACLRFRRYDLKTAIHRFQSYFEWRLQTFGDLKPQDASDETKLRDFLKLGVVRLLPDLGPRGHAFINVRLRLTRPDTFSADDVVRGIHFVMMKALRRSARTQIAGVIFINDMHGAGLANFDREVPKKALKMVNKNMPIRMAGIFFFRPNFMLQIVMPVVKLFMSEKLQRRLNIMHDENDIDFYGVPKSLRPIEIGGELKLPHVQMLWETDGWERSWVYEEGEEGVNGDSNDHNQTARGSEDEDEQEDSLTL